MTTKRIVALVGGHLLLIALLSQFLDFLPAGNLRNAKSLATISLLDTMSFYFNNGGFFSAVYAVLFTLAGALTPLIMWHAVTGKQRWYPLISGALATLCVVIFYFTLTSFFGKDTGVLPLEKVTVLLGTGFWLALAGGLTLIISGVMKEKKD